MAEFELKRVHLRRTAAKLDFMLKTQKELAFLRDLSIDRDWTARFTESFDKNYKFTDEESVLFINAGTGNHALAIRDRLDKKIEIFGVTEDEDLTSIASAKAAAIRANVGFSSFLPPDQFDLVIADASLVSPKDLFEFVRDVINSADERVVFFLPTCGSFGEIFSVLWETLLAAGLIEKGGEIERLIKEIPTVSDVENAAKAAGLKKLQVKTSSEIFEFESGQDFVSSTLIADFLMPRWIDFLEESEVPAVLETVAQTIDGNRDNLSYLFTVKATMVGGQK